MRLARLWTAAGLLLASCAAPPPPVPGAAAVAAAAVDRATRDTQAARAFGLDQGAWDLVRMAHEDIAAAETSIDNGEYAEAERLAAGASERLHGALAETVAARMGRLKAAVAEARRVRLPEARIAAADTGLAAAGAAAAAGDYLRVKSLLDGVEASLAPAPTD